MMVIRHSRGSYPVHFGSWEATRAALGSTGIVLTDSHVRPLLGDLEIPVLTAPPGENSKSMETYSRLVEEVAVHRVDRRGPIIAIGGGVVGDLAGFVAATYLRGVPLIQIPTTLLAMVDSSVGGKVGIDLIAGKNLLGAFWPPSAVYVCPEFLQTLPPREHRAGMAEVWKYGYIMSEPFVQDLRANSADPEQTVRACIAMKAQVVQEDEYETTGRRAILNFGHTIGHALEKVAGYGVWLHGEAVAIGMVAEAQLGEQIGITPPGTAGQIRADLAQIGLPTDIPTDLSREAMIQAMYSDKKAVAGSLSFSLLDRIGECRLIRDVAASDVMRGIAS